MIGTTASHLDILEKLGGAAWVYCARLKAPS